MKKNINHKHTIGQLAHSIERFRTRSFQIKTLFRTSFSINCDGKNMSKLLKSVIKCQWSVHKVYIDFCKRYLLAKTSLFSCNIFRELNDTAEVHFSLKSVWIIEYEHISCISSVVVSNSIFKRLSILYEKLLVSKVSLLNIENDIHLKTCKGKFKFYYKVWKAIDANCNKVFIVFTSCVKNIQWHPNAHTTYIIEFNNLFSVW